MLLLSAYASIYAMLLVATSQNERDARRQNSICASRAEKRQR